MAKKGRFIKESVKAVHGAGVAYVKRAIILIKKHTKDKARQKMMLKQIKSIEKSLHNLKKLAGR